MAAGLTADHFAWILTTYIILYWALYGPKSNGKLLNISLSRNSQTVDTREVMASLCYDI